MSFVGHLHGLGAVIVFFFLWLSFFSLGVKLCIYLYKTLRVLV
jgi:hypothetical protein